MNLNERLKLIEERLDRLENKDLEQDTSHKKITLKEFWDSDKGLAIHCNTKEKAETLLKAFDRMGKRWVDDEPYLENTNFHFYRDKTCYYNKGTFANLEFAKKMLKFMSLKM